MSSLRSQLFLVGVAALVIAALTGFIVFVTQGSLFPSTSNCDPVTITNPETDEPITGDSLNDAIDNWEQQVRETNRTEQFIDNYKENVNFVFNTVNGTQVLQIQNVGCGTQTVRS